MSIVCRPAKNAKVRKDLNVPPCSCAIKVLTDLENLRAAFFYRHLGPHGPKAGSPLHPEPLRRTQTALILFILFILSILLQTTEKRATGIKPMARFAGLAQHPKRHPSSGLEALHVYKICSESVPSVGQDRLILTCLRSGDRKLQRWDNCIVLVLEKLRAAFVYSALKIRDSDTLAKFA